MLPSLRRAFLRSALEIIPGVYQITVKTANIILIAGQELTLIDTSFRGSSKQVSHLLQTIGRRPGEISLIIVTHNHYDHAGGAAELKKLTGARVAVHRADIAVSEDSIPYPDKIKRLIQLRPFSVLRRDLTIDAGDVDVPLTGGEAFSPLGGLQIIHTPGHTPGSISVYAPQKKLLIVGDALDKNLRDVFPPHRSTCTHWKQALESAKMLSRLDCEVLVFGHGNPFVSGVRSKMSRLRAKIDVLS